MPASSLTASRKSAKDQGFELTDRIEVKVMPPAMALKFVGSV